jgi:sulfite exporter TauE/SafE/copper chaperone CopZ
MANCQVQIKGMHCRSCEILVENELIKIPGVDDVKVNYNSGIASFSGPDNLSNSDITAAVARAGYSLGRDERPFLSRNPADWGELGMAFLMALGLYFVASSLGLINLSQHGSNYNNLLTVLLVGLTAGVSTCMALVGGLVLGSSAKFAAKHPQASAGKKFTPHLFFNLGRITSYFVLGGVIGALGSVFQLSTGVLGWLTIGVGLTMLVLGGQLMNISPFLSKLSLTLPTGIAKFLGIKEKSNEDYSHTNSFTLGALTFFLPCGFTQAMQLYAMSTGSAISGAVTMGVFALGTAPGLLGVGGLTSLAKGMGARMFFKTAGVVVAALAIFNIGNGINLTGGLPSIPKLIFALASQSEAAPISPAVAGVQEIQMKQVSGGYSPNTFTIKRGVSVKWVITSQDVNTCAASIVVPKFGIRKTLKLGLNVIEFTPNEVGTIKFSCSMGMYTGSFNVIEDTAGGSPEGVAPTTAAASPAAIAGQGCSGSGGCGCGGAKKTGNTATVTPSAGKTVNQDNVQLIKASYTNLEDIIPNQFSVKVNQPVRFEIAAKEDGYGCMGSLALPGLSQQIEVLTKGKTHVFEFTPKKTGKFEITCAMGVPRGTINVQ